MLKKASKVGEILVCLKKPTGNTPPYPIQILIKILLINSWESKILSTEVFLVSIE